MSDTNESDVSQPFQLHSSTKSSEIIHIPTRLDSKSGQRVIRWKDIQQYFKRAKGLMNGRDVVLFLTDGNLEDLIPLRIAHYPGVVIEVVLGDDGTDDDCDGGQGASTIHSTLSPPSSMYSDITSAVTPAIIIRVSKDTNNLTYHDSNNNIEDSSVETHITSTQDTVTLCLTSTDDDAEDSSSCLTSTQGNRLVYNSYVRAIMSSQELQTSTIQNSMDGHFDKLQLEMKKNQSLQERLLQMQHKVEANQQEMLQLQKQALGRLAVIQNRVQALLVQTYELHEYPIPRLFVILPKPKPEGLREKLTTNPLVDQFRLYFLCECGTHTMAEGSRVPHEIHLAKHEGYDIEKPKEFFEKYGSYILTLMYMIKYGVMAAGLIVPPLTNSNILEGFDSVLKNFECFSSLVDDTIGFLQELGEGEAGSEVVAGHQPEFGKLEVLEGADLRQLESYLAIKDQGRVLGNLYRVVTTEGQVKWVCFDHYRSNYRGLATRQLQDVVEINDGKFTEETGKIKIKLASHILAKQFYNAMVKARGIQELEIKLKWDVSTEELRVLAKAVTEANVVVLEIDGSYLRGKKLEILSRERYFDPILRLASNGRIQSLRLVNFSDFFGRVDGPSSLTMAPKLRVLSIEADIPFKEPVANSFLSIILQSCPMLNSLDLRIDQRYEVHTLISRIICKLGQLELLMLNNRRLYTKVTISKGTIQSVSMKIARIRDLLPDDLEFSQKGYLEQLLVRYTPKESDERRLGDLLMKNPRIKK
ncbi:hypothetical protein BGZ65_002616, partial [Modicella reniformis]